jgi:hypothetical protein
LPDTSRCGVRLSPGLPAIHAQRAIIGPGGHLSYLFGRLCRRMPGLFYVRHQIVAGDSENMPSMPRGYSARLINAEELAGHAIDASLSVQTERFAANMLCLGAFNSRDVLVGVTWLDRRAHDEKVLGVRFALPPHAAWDGGLWIDEERRLSRAFVALWAGVKVWLEEQGLHQSISSIADYNAASLAAHRSLGAQIIGHVAVIRFGRYQLTFAGKRTLLCLTSVKRQPEIRL